MTDHGHLRLRGAPIIHDTIDNETIAINQLSGAYYSFEGPSALAWQALANGSNAAGLVDLLAAAYEGERPAIEAEVRSFLDQLLGEELVVPDHGDDRDRPVDLPSRDAKPPFTGLRLQRYTDLEVLLLADPIHEVDDTGWPMPVNQPGQ
jgi:hypothetical protein